MSDRMFPVLWQSERGKPEDIGCPVSVPWDFIASHRDACLRLHEQTPERLAERGGLSPSEMLAVVCEATDRATIWQLWTLPTKDAVPLLNELLAARPPGREGP